MTIQEISRELQIADAAYRAEFQRTFAGRPGECRSRVDEQGQPGSALNAAYQEYSRLNQAWVHAAFGSR